jgi:ribosomal protein S27E
LPTPTPQRIYRAPCPGCGAPVEFRSAQSTHAVCSFCRSTVVRSGETLARLGRMAELFDDHSPLQLMARGRFQDRRFTLVGRLQYRSGSGPWAEWQAVFDDGGTGLLAEDNGAYVFAFEASLQRPVPPASQLRLGATTAVAGKTFTVAANEEAVLVSAQGELPKLPPLDRPFAVVELRSQGGEVLAIDYGSEPPEVTRGSGVRLEALELTGLREDVVKEERARQFACPHCGAQVEVHLETSKSVTCPSCHSLIDLSAGIGGELRHAIQDEPVRPVIALGSVGQLQGAQWQVVGFQHRMGHEPGDRDELFGWSEYLLYHRKRGFLFLVDSEEGWSLVKPATGAPTLSSDERSATYLGTRYALKDTYEAETVYVAGEFYWPVERGQATFNRDYAAGNRLLSMERTPREVVWSSGETVAAATVGQAFGLADQEVLKRGDTGPTSGAKPGVGCLVILAVLVLIVLLVILLAALQDDNPSGSTRSRSSGGSWGGYSSGGGHK